MKFDHEILLYELNYFIYYITAVMLITMTKVISNSYDYTCNLSIYQKKVILKSFFMYSSLNI